MSAWRWALPHLLVLLATQAAPAAQERGIRVARKDAQGSLSAQLDGERYTFGTYHALLISIEKYPRPFAELRTPHEDVQRLRAVLREQYGFGPITVLQEQEATRAGILRAIGAYRGVLGPQDNLLVYFAGHGLKQQHGEHDEDADYYWVPYDATREFPSWVSVVEIQSLVRNIRARHVLLVSDSCFSGGLLRSAGVVTRAAPKSILSLHRKASSQVFTSGGLEPVADSGREGCSLFAYHLARRLEAHDGAFLTLRGLAHAVTADVAGALEARQVPELGPIRGARHEFGDFVFVRTRAPGEGGARPIAEAQEGVPAGWILPPGVQRRADGRFFAKSASGDEAEMVLVPGGRMPPRGGGEAAVVEPFLIDRFEVTNARFRLFLAAHPELLAELPALGRPGFDDPQQPVVEVPLEIARRFAAWAGKALPDERQWDCAAGWDAARGAHRSYPWGDTFADGGFAVRAAPPRAGAFVHDVSLHGVRDLGGGVRELCELPHRDPERGVIRGGTQFLLIRLDTLDAGLGTRRVCSAQDRFANVGFRCVLALRRP